MKHSFTFLSCVVAFALLTISTQAQVTRGAGVITNHETGIELPRVVKSDLTMPESFHNFGLNSKNAIDNKGTEFWLMMEQNYDTYVDGLYLDITSDVSTTGNVSIPGLSYSQDFSTTPGEITRITLPNDCQVITSETIESKGIHIVSEDEVTVYGLSLKAYTSDCFLALPLDILSSQYLVMSYPNFVWTGINSNTLGQFAVVSPYDNNTITITPTCETYNGSNAGVPITIMLDQGETYQLKTAVNNDPAIDFTGSIVQSTLPVALFSGNSCASIPTNYSACDIILEQIPPVSTWGNNFVTYPLEGRENGDTWRILSSQNNNNVYVNDVLTASLDFGDFYEFILDEPAKINSSKPVLVMQFSNGDDFDPDISYNGDPFMMLIPPEEQFMTAYTFATPSQGFVLNYVTITVPTEGISTLMLDGSPVDAGWFTPIGNTGFSAAGIEMSIGSHTINSTTNVPFGIYSYGFNGYDSYGYAGGLSLEFIYEGSAPVITRTPATVTACQQNHAEDEDIVIEVDVVDAQEPYTQAVYMYYESPPGNGYQMVEMDYVAGDTWSYSMTHDMTFDPGVNFYFTATDGQLFSSDPLIDPSNNPYSMAVLPNELPVISHDAVYAADYNTDLLISCQVTDETDYPESVVLNYRVHGGNPVFSSVEMSEIGKGVYSANIPGNNINENGTDYYISARDNFGVVARFPVNDNYVKLNQGVGIAENHVETAQVTVAPNPFNQETSIAIEMKETGKLLIELFDVTGKKIRMLRDTEMEAGVHHFTLRKGTLPEGIYLLKVKASNAIGSQKLIIK